jgi:hypothetical protein
MAGVLRLHILDGLLDELEAISSTDGALLRGAAVLELERLADLLVKGMFGTSPESIQRRVRVVELLRRADDGRLPALIADAADAFGVELQAMLASDEDLRSTLGHLYPLVSRATSVAPSGRWIRDARALMAVGEERAARIGAIRRVLAALVRADLVSRPDILVGGLRLANQRFARGLVWLAGVSFDSPAETLASIGLRMGTSGRSDAVVRDTALANTAAALLGESADEGAAAALASMRLEITNRVVLKQVDRALATQATRAGVTVDELIDSALPTFGLGAKGRRVLEASGATATIDVGLDGRVSVTWREPDGEPLAEPSAAIEAAEPGLVADAAALVDRILAALAEERRRHEQRLGSERSWPLAVWRRRFTDHPLGRIAARTLIWVVDGDGSRPVAVLPELEGWASSDDRRLQMRDDQTVRLWHPADAGAGERAAWRATLAARAITQAVRQADREIFAVDPDGASPAADVRHAGVIVDHGHLRAILRRRGWAVPALGAWDQGDEATAWHAFDDGLRAELRYQAPDRVPTGERVERARIVGVRFVRTDAPPATPADRSTTVLLADVPRRVFSEALRDVSLVVAS